MNELFFRDVMMSQLEAYLNGEISKEEYYGIAEEFYTKNVSCCENSEFVRIFTNSIPDACLIYILMNRV